MARLNLLSELTKRTIVCDGGMGTQLFLRGLAVGACSEQWNTRRPDDVKAIHAAYRQAGCDLLTTNTFGGSAPALQRHGLENQVLPLNRAGAGLAREAAGDACLVLGDIGPFGGFLEPMGDMLPDALMAIFADQASALQAGGADAVIIETMSDPAEVAIAVKAAKQVGNWPVLATYAYAHGEAGTFRTMMGTSVDEATRAAIDAGADVVGANCGTNLSLADYRRLAEAVVKAAGSTPVIFQPNAGSPQMVDGRLTYLATPAQMAELARDLVSLGVKIVGGCCGTNPEILTAMSAAVKGR